MRKRFHDTDLAAVPDDFLPPRMREIARLIGKPAALKLAGEFGGRRIGIPANASPRLKTFAALAQAVGAEAAAKLVASYGGEYFAVPKCAAAIRAVRDTAITRDANDGASYSTLAHRYDLSERQIGSILCGN